MADLSPESRLQLAALEGLVFEAAGLRLHALASAVPTGEAIVEIGAFCGKSTCYLASGAQVGAGAHVWTFDAWDLPGNSPGWHPTLHGYRTARERFDRQVRACGLTEQITAERARSLDAAKRWARPIGLLFIDGSHLYQDVSADFAAWSPHLVLGAAVVFDDYATPNNPGVTRLVRKLRMELSGWAWSFEPRPLAIVRRPNV